METKEITRKEFMEQVDYFRMSEDLRKIILRINNDRNITPKYKTEYSDTVKALAEAKTTLDALRSLIFTVDISSGEKFSIEEAAYYEN